MYDIFYKGIRLRPAESGQVQVLTEDGFTTLGWYSISPEFAGRSLREALTYTQEKKRLDNYVDTTLKERAGGNTSPRMSVDMSLQNNEWLSYARNVPDVGYNIGLAEMVGDKLRIFIDELDIDMPTVVQDFRIAISQNLPYPLDLGFGYKANTLIIHPQMPSTHMRDATMFLRAYRFALERRS